MSVHGGTVIHRGEKKASDTLELKLQGLVTHRMWVLAIEQSPRNCCFLQNDRSLSDFLLHCMYKTTDRAGLRWERDEENPLIIS